MAWFILAAAVFGNVMSNYMFKLAMDGFPSEITIGSLFAFAFNPFLWLGGIAAVTMLGCYLFTLRELGLANTYAAVTSLSLVGVTLVTAFILHQHISIQNIFGIGLVLVGIITIATSSVSYDTPIAQAPETTSSASAG